MKKLIFTIFTVCLGALTSQATIYYVDAAQGSDTSNGLFANPLSSPDGPVQTINQAISLAIDGDTIMVAAGLYIEQITIDKSLVLLGAQYGLKPSSTSRGSETILSPQTVDISRGIGTNNVQIRVIAGHVEINGFTLDGNNQLITSGENVNGVDVEIAYGITFENAIDSVNVSNNILLNYFECFVYGLGNGTVTGGHQIADNYLENSGFLGLLLEMDMYAVVSDNIMSAVPRGLIVKDFNLSTTNTFEMRNNWFKSALLGVELTDLSNGGKYILQSNTFESANVDASYMGVYLHASEENVSYQISGNVMKGGNNGYFISDAKQRHLKIVGDSITETQFGIVYNNQLVGARSDTLTLDGVRIANSGETALTVLSDDFPVNLRTPNTSFSNALTGLNLKGNVKWLPFNCSFNNNSNFYIYLDSTASGKKPNYDLFVTGCLFDGVFSPAMSHAASFTLEDKIHHYNDDPSMGYLTTKSNNYYITHNDGNTSLTRGLNRLVDGWNVHIRPVVSSESVIVNKTFTLNTYGYTELNSLRMNGVGKTLTLAGDLNIGNSLILTEGLIKSAIANALRLKETADVLGGNDKSFVDGIVYAKGNGTGNDTLMFPVGKGSDYRPATMFVGYSAPSGITEYSMELFNSALPFTTKSASLKNISRTRYWNPQVYGAPSISSLKYRLSYGTTATNDQVTDPSSLRMAAESGGNITDIGGVGSSAGSGTIESTAASVVLRRVLLANAVGGTNLLGNNIPLASFSVSNICIGTSLDLKSTSRDPFTSLTYFHWDFGIDTASNDTAIGSDVSYVYPVAGNFTIRLAIRNVFGQTDTITRNIVVADKPNLGFTYVSNCFPTPVNFNATAGSAIGSISEYRWDMAGTDVVAEDPSFGFSTPGTYNVKLKVTTSYGCIDSVTQSVLYDSLPPVRIAPAGIVHICDGDTLTLNSANTHLRYAWSTGSTTNSTRTADAGEIVLLAHSSNDCSASDTVFVVVEPLPVVSAGRDTTIYIGSKLMLFASGAESYKWNEDVSINDTSIFNPTVNPKVKTTYVVTGRTMYGCLGTDTVMIDVKYPTTIRVPNIITPNNDGHNDVWDLTSVPGIDNSKVVILDRWGSLIYESDKAGYDHKWNGTRLDLEYPEGTYYYIIDLYDFKETVKGALLLVR